MIKKDEINFIFTSSPLHLLLLLCTIIQWEMEMKENRQEDERERSSFFSKKIGHNRIYNL